ncbi:PadR family transcriptional regulator [Pyrococcus abyssi]|uniref:Predicted transcriptional regulator n=1 Tax=Pyrococcus abyssi (strain GE5 / Orsay) TaxID=272844 RepID=Q9V1D5_PYRAB|nr:PadR family transcriptional regulator [Pyrococcus abyssi]CAB49414.1 Predicted transcriptional regulator [Pyrococcus abyssi GE5]CCE69881.1 TPA: transcription regulator, PadR-like family [Pyrococcus abyssi GE5]
MVNEAVRKLRKEIRSGLYSYLILLILNENEKLHGYAIRKRLEELTDGKLVPSEGALYSILKMLKKYKLVEDYWAEVGGRVRRYYQITELGKEVLDEIKEEIREIRIILERIEKG